MFKQYILFIMLATDKKKDIIMNEKQNIALNLMNSGKNVFVTGSAGTGKCLAFNTKVIMYSGETKYIQDIKKGEMVMGDDSTPRTVLSTTSGRDTMYKVSNISDSFKDNYTVNESHILTFCTTSFVYFNAFCGKYYLEYPDHYGIIKTRKFNSYYELRLFRNKKVPKIIDIPILMYNEYNSMYLRGFYAYIDFESRYIDKDPYTVGFCSIEEIPDNYIYNTMKIRIEVLAGILDSGRIYKKNFYFLIKSLGFSIKNNKIEGSIYSIVIPTKTENGHKLHCRSTNHDSVFDISIEKQGVGDYYGFVLDGNHRFILGNFIVTHNTEVIKKYIENNIRTKIIGVTSTTGISALLFGGSTIHSYLGLSLGNGSVDYLVNKIKRDKKLRKKWTYLETLVVDEVSMLNPDLFSKIDSVAKIIRINSNPFGGIQLILSGDFCQLPCVGCDDFCFETDSWKNSMKNIIYLTDIVRQKNKDFQKCLNDIRIGKVSYETKEILNKRIGVELKNEYGIKPTNLYTTNSMVDADNEKELDKLADNDPDFYEYERTVKKFSFDSRENYIVDKFVKMSIVPEKLILCVEAQVMLLYNIGNGLVNGSRGVVIGFKNDIPIVKFLNGAEEIISYQIWEVQDPENCKRLGEVSQIPLKLAYALTVHKSQGCSLDYARIDLTNCFTYGQSYVALSRVKNIEGLSLLGIDYDKIKANQKAVEFYKEL
jgi:ATP-dependent DNA helicase PIF1